MNYSDWCVERIDRVARHHSSLSDNEIIHKLVLNINFSNHIYYFLFNSHHKNNPDNLD